MHDLRLHGYPHFGTPPYSGFSSWWCTLVLQAVPSSTMVLSADQTLNPRDPLFLTGIHSFNFALKWSTDHMAPIFSRQMPVVYFRLSTWTSATKAWYMLNSPRKNRALEPSPSSFVERLGPSIFALGSDPWRSRSRSGVKWDIYQNKTCAWADGEQNHLI